MTLLRGNRLFGALLGFCAVLALVFLAIPIISLLTAIAPSRLLDLLTRPAALDALVVTIQTNLVANALILMIGTPAAYLLARRSFRGRNIVLTAIEVPLVLPPAVAGIALLAAFGTTGMLGKTLAEHGLVLPFTELAVVLAVTFVAAPFYLRAAISAFSLVDRDTLDAAAGKDRLLHRQLARLPVMETATDLRVLALRILADDDKIDRTAPFGKWTSDTRQQSRRPQTHVLVEASSDRDQQPPQRDVIGHIWAADRAQENRVRFCETVERVVVHHRAGTDVVIAAPQVLRPLDAEARQWCERIEHDAGRGNRLDADAVARD